MIYWEIEISGIKIKKKFITSWKKYHRIIVNFPFIKQAQEIKFDAHTKHGYNLKIVASLNEILKVGLKLDALLDLTDSVFSKFTPCCATNLIKGIY